MAQWPEHPTELFNQTTQLAQREDWNNARQYRTGWEDMALAGTTAFLGGDGAYRITYTGAQTLDTIAGLTNGDRFTLSADVTGAGGALTIAHGAGNIQLNAGISLVFDSDFGIAEFKMIGTTACLISFAHP